MNESMQALERIPSRCPLCGDELRPDILPLAADSPCPHCGKPLWFVHRQVEHVVIVDFSPGRILKEDEFRVLREFLFAQSPMPKVILNLTNCPYFSDTTLAGFILLYKRLTEARGKLKICCLRSPMLDVFKLARLDQLFDIFDDEKSALASF
jgi:anti-sigma B factor antagonist